MERRNRTVTDSPPSTESEEPGPGPPQGTTRRDAVELEAERIFANPSFPMALMMSLVTMGVYIGISRVIHLTLDWDWWPPLLLSIVVAYLLVQPPPRGLAEDLPPGQRRRDGIPLWIARTIVMVVCVATYDTFSTMTSPRRWIFLLVMAILYVPLIWFRLLEIRVAGMLRTIGLFSRGNVAVVIALAVLQIVVWGSVVAAWFSGRLGLAVLVTVVAVVSHPFASVVLARHLPYGGLAGLR